MNPPVFDDSWSEEVVALYKHDMQEIWDPEIAPQIWNQYHSQLDLYLSLINKKTKLDIMDVGCAQGTLALKLAEAGHRVCAVDLRQDFLKYAESRYEFGDVEFVQGNVLDLKMERLFDVIFANQIIEHLVYPLTMIKRLKRFLKKDGRLVVTTPNGDYVVNNLPSYSEIGDPSQFEDRQFTADGDGHFFAYRLCELEEIFSNARFASIDITFFETPWISGHMKFRYLHRKVPASILRAMDKTLLNFPLLNRFMSHQLMVVATNQ